MVLNSGLIIFLIWLVLSDQKLEHAACSMQGPNRYIAACSDQNSVLIGKGGVIRKIIKFSCARNSVLLELVDIDPCNIALGSNIDLGIASGSSVPKVTIVWSLYPNDNSRLQFATNFCSDLLPGPQDVKNKVGEIRGVWAPARVPAPARFSTTELI